MEETACVNSTRGVSAESSSHRMKGSDHRMQQLGSYNVFKTLDSEHISFLTSPCMDAETLGAGSLNFRDNSQFGSEAQSGKCFLQEDHDDTVRELTIKNYQSSEAFGAGCYEDKDKLQSKGGLLEFTSVVTGGAKNQSSEDFLTHGSRLDAGNMPLLPCFGAEMPISCAQMDRNLILSDNLAEDYIWAKNQLISSCNPQSFVPNAFDKKDSRQHPAAYGESDARYQSEIGLTRAMQLSSNTVQNSVAKVENSSLLNGTRRAVMGVRKDEMNLREYLMLNGSNLNEGERWNMFKQIAELTAKLHSRSFVLKKLRPSFFIVSSSKQVKYVGDLISECQTEPLAKKRNVEKVSWTSESPSAKIQKVSSYNLSSGHLFHTSSSSERLDTDIKTRGILEPRSSITSVRSSWEQQDKYGIYKPHNALRNSDIASEHAKNISFNIIKVEESWYCSPEELSHGHCYSSSNIYSLGILLFELLSKFKTSEAHSTAMSDLHQRVLPPRFLREYPKEAGICLWMLHPESFSRPKIRDILRSDIFNRDKGMQLADDLSLFIDKEESDSVLSDFLMSLKERKEKQEAILRQELQILGADVEEIERRCMWRGKFSTISGSNTNFLGKSTQDKLPTMESVSILPKSKELKTSIAKNVDQLESVYFSMRSKIGHPYSGNQVRADLDLLKNHDQVSSANKHASFHHEQKESADYVGSFFEGLCKYARYSRFDVCGVLSTSEHINSTNVICSLSFDSNEDYFAAAGISKKIKIFEFDTFLNDKGVHYPIMEMPNNSKLSCICWNSYIGNYLASTDYEGVVQLWDVYTGQGLTKYSEHQKRAWSVDFSQAAPTKLASGSDDTTVKIWSIHEKNSINTIKNIANVCSVQFSSHSPHLLAFGSADYKIYLFDLRNTRTPWCRLAGHERAVSYVKFLDSETLVSASTDNSLKLWDLKNTSSVGLSTNACALTMKGHSNEKNFIGLSVSDGYIVCGSENNEVYAYYKDLPMPITSHKFGHMDATSFRDVPDDNGLFVSSVCWRTKSNMVLAGNSSGCIKLLRMV